MQGQSLEALRSMLVAQETDAKKAVLVDGLDWVPGAGNRNRTYDLIITNDALYQLSYSGSGADFRETCRPGPVEIAVSGKK